MGRPVGCLISPAAASGARRRGALGVAPLFLLLLLLPRGGAPAGRRGETCRRWREGHLVPGGAFLCPEKFDRADARLCCGTCAWTYCCSSEEARLDERPCFRPAWPGEVTPEGPPAASAPPAKLDHFMLGLAVSLTLLLFFGCFLVFSYESLECCAGPCRRRQDPAPEMAAALLPMSSLEDPSPPGPLDLRLPSSSRERLVPPSSDEDPPRD